jgi:hypothetical protein
MREFGIDLVIDKTFNVFAETVEEAKELAIQRARQLMGTYNSLIIDEVEEIEEEDLEFENEYEVLCFNTDGILVHEYLIEADHTLGAATAAEEFFADDFPNERLATVRVIIGEDFDSFEEYNI